MRCVAVCWCVRVWLLVCTLRVVVCCCTCVTRVCSCRVTPFCVAVARKLVRSCAGLIMPPAGMRNPPCGAWYVPGRVRVNTSGCRFCQSFACRAFDATRMMPVMTMPEGSCADSSSCLSCCMTCRPCVSLGVARAVLPRCGFSSASGTLDAP